MCTLAFMQIHMQALRRREDNFRSEVDPRWVTHLLGVIDELPPIVVRVIDPEAEYPRYEVIDGNYRLEVHRLHGGYHYMECEVVEATDAEAAEMTRKLNQHGLPEASLAPVASRRIDIRVPEDLLIYFDRYCANTERKSRSAVLREFMAEASFYPIALEDLDAKLGPAD